MDPIDILGSVLGHKKSGSGRGADILRDILRGGPTQSRRRQATRPGAPRPQPHDLERDAKELEELLKVANDRDDRHVKPASRSAASKAPFRRNEHATAVPENSDAQGERALVLARAMINAAKSDGRLTEDEQSRILNRLGDASPEATQFLREEFAKPLDVGRFAMSVPLGMERQVYKISLIAIDLDTSQEAKYLLALSKALRMPDDVREEIHEELGAPSIY